MISRLSTHAPFSGANLKRPPHPVPLPLREGEGGLRPGEGMARVIGAVRKSQLMESTHGPTEDVRCPAFRLLRCGHAKAWTPNGFWFKGTDCELLFVKSFFTLGALLFALVLSSLAAEPSRAELEGRALVADLLSQIPAESFTNSGVMKKREAKGWRGEIPVRIETTITPTNWQTAYFAFTTNGVRAISLTVVHREHQPNLYRLESFARPSGQTNRFLDLSGDGTTIPFAGSDLWVGDLGMEFLRWPEQRVLKSEMRRGRACKVLESVNPAPTTNGYARVVSWIDNETDGIVRAEAYDQHNKLFKECEPKGFKKVKGRWELREMRIRNLKTGSQTVMEFDLQPE